MKIYKILLFFLILLECFLINYFFISILIPEKYSNFNSYLIVHIKSFIIMNIMFFVLSYILKVYDFKNSSTYQFIFQKLIEQVFLLGLFLFAIAGVRENRLLENKDLIIVISEIFVSFFLLRYLFLYLLRYLTERGYNTENVVFLGSNDLKYSLVRTLTENKVYGLKLVKAIPFDPDNINDLSFLNKIVVDKKVTQAYLFLNNTFSDDCVQKINEYCENNLLTLKIIPQRKSYLNSDLETEYLDRYRILTYKKLPFELPLINFYKRSFDVIFSLIVIVFLLSWLMPLMALIIKLTSRGPIFFLQERIGVEGKPFKIIKFRTMKIDAEKHGPQLAKDKDPRVTLIGGTLRKYRIDELPQFINVLIGDMSIVGPRPEREFYVNQIIKINPRYKRLHNLKPGITSLGQVYYGYAENVKEMSERLNYDLLYLNNYNLTMDIKIIFLTIWVMIKGKGK